MKELGAGYREPEWRPMPTERTEPERMEGEMLRALLSMLIVRFLATVVLPEPEPAEVT